MPKRRKKKKFVFRSSIVFMLFLVFCGSLVYYAYDLNSKMNEKEKLEEELVTLQNEEVILKSDLRKLGNEDYVARFARERHSYSREGELIIRITE